MTNKHTPDEVGAARPDQADANSEEKMDELPPDLGTETPAQRHPPFGEQRTQWAELELVKEELRATQIELAAARELRAGSCNRTTPRYCTLSSDGLIREASPALAAFLGIDRGALVRKPFVHFIFPDDRELFREHRQMLEATGAPQVSELRMLRGSEAPVSVCVESEVVRTSGEAPASRVTISGTAECQRIEPGRHQPESRADFLLSASPAVTYTCAVTPPYAATYVSRNITDLLGYSSEEFVATPDFWADHIHPEDRDRVFAGVTELFVHGSLLHEYRFRHRNGTWRWVRDALRMELGPDGHPAELIGYFIDDTTRKESEIEHAGILDAAQDGFWVVDSQGRLLEVSDAYCRMSGYSAGELLTMKVSDLEALEDDEATAKHVQQIFEQGNERFESRHRRKDGSVFDIEVDAQYLPIQGGRIVGFARDISERKQAEEELREAYGELEQRVAERTAELRQENEALQAEIAERVLQEEALREYGRSFKAIVERLPLAIYVSTGLEQVCEYLNPTFVELFGYTMEDIPTIEQWWRLAYPDAEYRRQVSEEWNRRIGHALETRSSIKPIEAVVTCKDGSRRQISWGYISLLTKSFAYGLDLTDRMHAMEATRKLDKQAWQSQKFESLERVAGAIAHRFNNDLQAVIGNLELVLDEVPGGCEANGMLVAAMRAARKASELSGLMRTYTGQIHTNRSPVDLSEVSQHRLSLLRAACPKRVAMEASIPCPGPTVRADSGQMQQILMSLVTNAWEAIGESQGVVSVRIWVSPAAEIPEENRFPVAFRITQDLYACLEVADTGSGIEIHILPTIFDPFFSTKFTGRGMGLAAVLGIVRAHQGVVAVVSEPSRGSVFRVFLPLSDEVVAQPLWQLTQPLDMKESGTILVVEDEEPLRRLMARVLAGMGFDVLEAKDGLEAIDIFRQHQDDIRLVVSDLFMPCLDGWGTLDALRKIRPGVRFILASGYSKAEVMGRDHAEKPDALLRKPYGREQLCDAVRQSLPRTAAEDCQ